MTAAKKIAGTSVSAAEVGKQIDYLARALKAPRIREAAARTRRSGPQRCS